MTQRTLKLGLLLSLASVPAFAEDDFGVTFGPNASIEHQGRIFLEVSPLKNFNKDSHLSDYLPNATQKSLWRFGQAVFAVMPNEVLIPAYEEKVEIERFSNSGNYVATLKVWKKPEFKNEDVILARQIPWPILSSSESGDRWTKNLILVIDHPHVRALEMQYHWANSMAKDPKIDRGIRIEHTEAYPILYYVERKALRATAPTPK